MNIQQIKEKYSCLDYLGERVVRKTSYGYLARCPWREDIHPSLTITANGKGWKDHATGEHGGLIELVMRCLNTTDFQRVCAQFENLSSFDSSKVFNCSKEKVNGFASINIVPLASKALFQYLTERCIDLSIARQYLQEAHYSFQQRNDGRFLFALAYRNDKGGVELRSKLFKGCRSPKAITTHWHTENAATVVFEGFFDMLSFATLCGGVRHNYVVLNSIVNVDAAIDILKEREGKIFLCLDYDVGGRSTTKKMLDALPGATDISHRFAPHKDVNEYLCKNNVCT